MYGAVHCGCLLPQLLTDIACALILHRQKAAMQGRLLLFGITRRSVNLLRHPLRIFIADYVANIKNGTYVYTQEVYDDITLGMIARKDGKPMFGVE